MNTNNSNIGNEIINATQNAVIETIENVAEMIENQDVTHTHEHEAFYLSAEFWVAVAFVTTVTLLSRPIYRLIQKMINNNIDNIRNKLEEAEQIQMDAEKLLASYERKFRNVRNEANEILKKSQNEINYLRKASLTQLEQSMKLKEQDMMEKIKSSRENAINEIANTARNLSLKAARQIIQNNLSDKDISKLIDTSIEKINKVI